MVFIVQTQYFHATNVKKNLYIFLFLTANISTNRGNVKLWYSKGIDDKKATYKRNCVVSFKTIIFVFSTNICRWKKIKSNKKSQYKEGKKIVTQFLVISPSPSLQRCEISFGDTYSPEVTSHRERCPKSPRPRLLPHTTVWKPLNFNPVSAEVTASAVTTVCHFEHYSHR